MPNPLPKPLGRRAYFVADVTETPLSAVDAINEDAAPLSLWAEAWRNLRRRPIFIISAILIIFLVIVALFPGLFTHIDPMYCPIEKGKNPPEPGHPFGFTLQGCDVYSRVIHGTRASLEVGILTTLGVVLLGGAIGAIAGYYGKWFDTLLSRLTDIFFAIPLVLGAIVVMQGFRDRANVFAVVLVLLVFGWPQITRITRGAVISVRNADFITASTALGASRFKILLRHIVPNAMAPVIVTATVSLGTFIVTEATLSFLGIGLPGSVVSWGADIANARPLLRTNPMVLFYPAVALAVTVLSFIMLGDAVRDALDPKARKR